MGKKYQAKLRTPSLREELERLWPLLFIWVFAGVLYFLANYVPAVAEWYARNIYPAIASVFVTVFSFLPFSLAEFVVYLAVLSVIVCFVLYIVRVIRARRYWYVRLLSGLLSLFIALGIFVSAFLALWGINYYRDSFAKSTGLDVHETSVEELYALCQELAEKANLLREQVSQTEEGTFRLPYSKTTALEKTSNGFENAQERFPILKGTYGRPKSVLYSQGMSWLGITGIYFPFTFEANVNTDIPESAIPFTSSHETAHLIGFAREDECNFIAYLACIFSDDVSFRYSGVYNALIYATNALYRYDTQRHSEVMSSLSEGVQRDISQTNQYWQQFEGPIQEAHESINDAYLKLNGQEDGVNSYGRMVDLLLAFRRENLG